MRSTQGHWRHAEQIQHRRHRLVTAQLPVAVPPQADPTAPEEQQSQTQTRGEPGEASQASDVGQADRISVLARTVAVAAYLTAALLSLLPPVLIYLLCRRSAFARAHA